MSPQEQTRIRSYLKSGRLTKGTPMNRMSRIAMTVLVSGALGLAGSALGAGTGEAAPPLRPTAIHVSYGYRCCASGDRKTSQSSDAVNGPWTSYESTP
jgi:hypothetical protein